MTDSPESGPTPGPWNVVWEHGRASGIHAPTDPHQPGGIVVVVYKNGIGCPLSPQGQANARLLAASWELREALRHLVDRHDNLVSSGDCGNWDVETEPEMVYARAALAKADGR